MSEPADNVREFVRPVPRIPWNFFAASHLGIKGLYSWQSKAIYATQLKPVSLLCCNGGGKSSTVLPSIILGFLYNFPKGRVAITSGSNQQLENQLWPAIEQFRFREIFKGWTWNNKEIITPQGGFASGFSTDDPNRLEGWHQDLVRDSPVLYVVDEAKAISPTLFKGIFKCTFTFFIMASSAGRADGVLYDSQTKLANLVFVPFKVTYKDCPHISEEKYQQDRLVQPRSTIAAQYFSEFDAEAGEGIFDWDTIHSNVRLNGLAQNYGVNHTFCDFAAGRDENVIARRQANYVRILATSHIRDVTQSAHWFVDQFKKFGLERNEIDGDAGGMGLQVIQTIRKLGWQIGEVYNQSPPTKGQETHYANLGSEVWFRGEVMVRNKEVILPNDSLLHHQLTSRRKTWDEKERLMAEPKKLMAARGIQSPDRADAVLGAMVIGNNRWGSQQIAEVAMDRAVFAGQYQDWSVLNS